VETDIVGASRRLPHALLVVAPPIALFALLVLPVALAVSQLVRRQVRHLAEAVATGLLAGAAAEVANILLSGPAAARLYDAIIMARPGVSHVDALDPYLAGLVAYATMIGLAGRPAWRNALGLAISVYAIVHLAALHTTVLSILITLLVGRAIGLAVRYGAGSTSQRPPARDIAAALSTGDLAVTAIRRVRQTGPGWPDPVTTRWRRRTAASSTWSCSTGTSRRWRVLPAVPLGPSAGTGVTQRPAVGLPHDRAQGPSLLRDRRRGRAHAAVAHPGAGRTRSRRAGLRSLRRDRAGSAKSGSTDAELGCIWDAVTQLHAHHVTHRGLTADRIVFTADDRVMLLDPGDGDVAASDLQIHLDLAQLIAELALFVGPEKSAGLAVEKVAGSELVAVLPLLRPVALARSTRKALRRRRDVLPTVRKMLLAAVPGGEVTPVQLERIRPRTLVTLVASVAAIYLLAGELARASPRSLLRSADWRWGVAALALSAVTYVGAALSLSGFVSERLNFLRTLLVQLASSFVTLVTPAAVGGAALNVRYLQRRKIPASVAVASVGVSQVVAFALHILLLVVFAAIAGTGTKSPLTPPTWAYFVLAGLVVLAGVVLAVPAGRRLVRARLSPTFGQVLPRLLEVAQHPRKLAESIGGALLLSLAYILCLAACVAAFGRSVPFAKIGFVYLTGSAIGSIIPTPGGLGAVEAALTAGLTAAGVPGAVAVSAVLLFRLLTFWLPVPFGWAALNFLEHQQDL
jgi:uncharacterized membrane protein YbhN (UPF0104 family)